MYALRVSTIKHPQCRNGELYLWKNAISTLITREKASTEVEVHKSP